MSKSNILKKSQTNWERLDAMRDEDIDFSDIPEITPEMFASAVVKRGLEMKPNKSLFTLRVDQDVLNWFRSQGRGYQSRINALLRAYMEANISQSESVRQQDS